MAETDEGWDRAIEVRSIDYVPANERHGRVWQQALFWFLGNFNFFTIAIGFVGPSQGLAVGPTIAASVAGMLFGTVFMALHASQGPDLGLPQLIQSRAQFGFKGVLVPLAASLFTFLTFNIVDTMLVSQGIGSLVQLPPVGVGIVISGLAVVLAIYGHDWLHRIFQVLFWISVPVFVVITFSLASGWIQSTATPAVGFSWLAFASQFAVTASYNITFAPYVSDYTRYLPRETSRGSLIMSVYLGASLSSIWLIALGAWLAVHIGAVDGMVALKVAGDQIAPLGGTIAVAISVCALAAAMSLNAYSGMLTLLTAVDVFRPVRRSRSGRLLAILLLAGIWLAISYALNENAIGALYMGLTVMLYVLAPWSAINLVDYFLLRRRLYAVTELQKPHGIYGVWNARGLVSYAFGLLAGVPFFSLPGHFTGPISAAIGGVDVAWLPELVIAAGLYAALNRHANFDAEWDLARREQLTLDVAAPSGIASAL
ncbi:MAG: nucleobase:cation symporter, family [Sphingomonadales bacterium]|jgi:purine-cytosine permease-like protein|nr:nucleobase:cation symporter, family [Sphingomonadales bacterium]